MEKSQHWKGTGEGRQIGLSLNIFILPFWAFSPFASLLFPTLTNSVSDWSQWFQNAVLIHGHLALEGKLWYVASSFPQWQISDRTVGSSRRLRGCSWSSKNSQQQERFFYAQCRAGQSLYQTFYYTEYWGYLLDEFFYLDSNFFLS